MSEPRPNLDSLFDAALEIDSPGERAAFVADASGDDAELREQLENLLRSSEAAGSFLEQPPAEFGATVLTGPEANDRAAALEAGLAATFYDETAVVVGNAGHSVLKALDQTISMPRVALRESQAEGDDPITRPNSLEMPERDSDSRYRLDGEIARGGMGAILKGRDIDLGRDLAIKVLLDSHKDKPEVIQRFVEEAQIGGQLQHPGISPVYELGHFRDRRPFFAMKLVKGQTLSRLLADREDASEERTRFLGIFEQVCQTMAYAHSRGVIHRDLKPANIMVGAFGEVQVMDWGLAKVLPAGGVADEKKSQMMQQGQSIIQTLRSGVGSDSPAALGSVGSETQMGSVMGTPAYMPPEQALGEIDNMDERADVFGLGAILCEILTGKPPYVAEDGTRVYRMASRGKLEDCFGRLDDSGADPDLIAIAKHCLELEPADRPRDASVLAEKITEYLESVEARLRETEMQRAAESARAVEARKRMRVTIALAVTVLVSLGIGGAGWRSMELKEIERREVATSGVNSALSDALIHQNLAESASLDARVGELDKAVEHARLAFTLVEQEDVEPALARRARQLLTELETSFASAQQLAGQVHTNRKLLEELELIRLGLARGTDDSVQSVGSEPTVDGSEVTTTAVTGEGTSQKYAQAFLKAGLDVKNSSVEEIVAWIHQSAIQEEVIAELDNWRRLFPLNRFAFDASVEARNWNAAVHIAQLAVQQQPENAPYKLGLAIALAAAGNKTELRKHALGMISKYRESRDKEELLRTVHACCLLPGVVDPAEIPAEWFQTYLPKSASVGWDWAMRAFLAYRSGQPDEALSCLVHRENAFVQSEKTYEKVGDKMLPLKALVLHQLKRTDEARKCLDEANRILGGLTWKQKCDPDALAARLLLREAQIAINGHPDPQLAAELAPGTGPAQVEAELLGKLLLVLDGADSNAWRKRLRAALIAEDTTQLVELARADETGKQSAALRAWLGAVLREVGEQAMSIQTLQAAQQQFPADFWLNFELGQSLTRAGRTLEGLGYMRAAIAIRPDSAAALMGVVSILEDEQERDAIFRRVVALDSGNAETQFRIAESFVSQGRLAEGIAAYRKAVSLEPSSSEYHYRLALALKANGDMPSAIEEFDRSVKVQVSGFDYHLNLGRILRDQGELDRAVTEFRMALEEHSFSWGYFELGELLNRQGNRDEAIVLIRRAIKTEPQKAEYKQKVLNRIWQETEGGLQAAIADLRQEIATDPENDWLHHELGQALQAAGAVEESRDAFRKAVELDPKSPWHYQALGNILVRQGDLDAAAVEFQKAIELTPSHAAFHGSLVDVFQRQGKIAEAISAYRNAITYNRQNSTYHVQLARLLEANAELDKAIAEYRRAIAITPEYAHAHIRLGVALKAQGMLDEAIGQFRVAVKLNPNDSQTFNEAAWILVTNADEEGHYSGIEQAVTWARRANELSPNNAAYQNTLGTALYRAEQWQDAIDALQKSIDNGGDMPHNWLFIAMAHWQLGQKDKARPWDDKSLAWQTANPDAAKADTELQSFYAEAAALMKPSQQDSTKNPATPDTPPTTPAAEQSKRKSDEPEDGNTK